jgi:hypothetical protein
MSILEEGSLMRMRGKFLVERVDVLEQRHEIVYDNLQARVALDHQITMDGMRVSRYDVEEGMSR